MSVRIAPSRRLTFRCPNFEPAVADRRNDLVRADAGAGLHAHFLIVSGQRMMTRAAREAASS